MAGLLPYPDTRSNPSLMALVAAGEVHPQPAGCPSEVYAELLRCWKFDAAARTSFGDLRTFFERPAPVQQRPEDPHGGAFLRDGSFNQYAELQGADAGPQPGAGGLDALEGGEYVFPDGARNGRLPRGSVASIGLGDEYAQLAEDQTVDAGAMQAAQRATTLAATAQARHRVSMLLPRSPSETLAAPDRGAGAGAEPAVSPGLALAAPESAGARPGDVVPDNGVEAASTSPTTMHSSAEHMAAEPMDFTPFPGNTRLPPHVADVRGRGPFNSTPTGSLPQRGSIRFRPLACAYTP